MMDKSEVKKWVDENIEALLRMFGVPHWKVILEYGPCPSGGAGECKKHVEYEQARIWLDPEEIENTDDLERILKHEIGHIVHSPFDIFWCSVMAYVPDAAAEDAMKNLWRHCQELMVKNLERMHRGHVDALAGKEDA